MNDFLPLTHAEMQARGWEQPDFVVVTGDAYVDHPSFGTAIISRIVESHGFRTAILSQPDYTTCESFREFGRPRFAFLIGGGNVDSMVAHYTVALQRRKTDDYTAGGIAGKRPDRAATVYSRLAKEAYPDVPVILGGLEASLRRFAHYDYWQDKVLPSVLEDSKADLLSFGMSERQTEAICLRLAAGEPISQLQDIPGTCYLVPELPHLTAGYVECASFAKVSADKHAYAKACQIQMNNQDIVTAKPILQKQVTGYVVQNIPAKPLNRADLDKLYTLPFTRHYHPSYTTLGGVPAIEEVQFSITHNRGCFGGCNFCAITMHQGRRVTSRSKQSIVEEAQKIILDPNFKGYIHDIGGPSANFRFPSCKEQMTRGMCNDRKCLAPSPCSHLIVDHSEYLDILRTVRELPGVKKVFVRSGIRYDYLLRDKDESFFRDLVKYHVSGQLKVAPEHCAPDTLRCMGKPDISVYDRFCKRFHELTCEAQKKQYLVPYLISSHPGSTVKDAVLLAEYLCRNHIHPEQVQDFYPTPGTVSTCMFYTGLDPATMKPVYVARTKEEKSIQRALLQYFLPANKAKVLQALKDTGRTDLIALLIPSMAEQTTAKPSSNPVKRPDKKSSRPATGFTDYSRSVSDRSEGGPQWKTIKPNKK